MVIWFGCSRQATENPCFCCVHGVHKSCVPHVCTCMAFYRCLDWSSIKPKMIYSSSKDTVKKALAGLTVEFEVNAEYDMDYGAMQAEVEKRHKT